MTWKNEKEHNEDPQKTKGGDRREKQGCPRVSPAPHVAPVVFPF
jgi:hypothetical protein